MMDSMTDSRDVSPLSGSGRDVAKELAASGALDAWLSWCWRCF